MELLGEHIDLAETRIEEKWKKLDNGILNEFEWKCIANKRKS